MNTLDFEDLFGDTLAEVRELTTTKGMDYASGDDRLINFKRAAANLGLTPYQVWGVYANKHWDAINTFIKNNGQVESEPIESRVLDVIVYSILLLGLIKDGKKA